MGFPFFFLFSLFEFVNFYYSLRKINSCGFVLLSRLLWFFFYADKILVYLFALGRESAQTWPPRTKLWKPSRRRLSTWWVLFLCNPSFSINACYMSSYYDGLLIKLLLINS